MKTSCTYNKYLTGLSFLSEATDAQKKTTDYAKGLG
jgi:hypothetical protein